MLPRKNRIARRDFAPLLASRSFVHSPHFVARVSFTLPEPRVAVSVSKKVSKSAVVRNTIRRRAYSALAGMLPEKGTFLLVAKPGSEKVHGQELKSEVARLLKEAESRYNS